MLKSIVLLLAIGMTSVLCDLKDFPDSDAFFIAQKSTRSLLEPPKELYDQIVKELSAVKKAYPEISALHYEAVQVPGKLICFNIALQKLNDSKEFGPIRVEGIGTEKLDYPEVMITFTKPYHPEKLESVLTSQFGDQWENKTLTSGCRSVTHWGPKSQIQRSQQLGPNGKPSLTHYYFIVGSGNCFVPGVVQCEHTKHWMFEIDAELMAKTGEIRVKQIPYP